MNNDKHNLIAFLSVLSAIVLLFMIASVLLYFSRSVEAIGIGGAITGLIGVLGTFRPQQRPSQVGPNENVNVEGEKP
jgi:hypothetical protein